LTLPDTEQLRNMMKFELWRQDDNGNRFLVGSFGEWALAEARLAELTRCQHKQTYWIEEQPSPEPDTTEKGNFHDK
jgi:hypothetical protein